MRHKKRCTYCKIGLNTTTGQSYVSGEYMCLECFNREIVFAINKKFLMKNYLYKNEV